MITKIKHFVAYNFLAILVAIQVVMLINYWYFLLKNVSQAGTHETIAYQGKIIDNDGVPIDDGTYNMRFRVFDQPDDGDADAGNELWREEWNGVYQGSAGAQVQVTNGIFSVELNSLCSDWTAHYEDLNRNPPTSTCAMYPGGVNFNTDSLYLQAELDTDGGAIPVMDEIFLPRKRFTSTAYAMNAAKVMGSEVGDSGHTIPLLDGGNTWSGTNLFNNILTVSALNSGADTFNMVSGGGGSGTAPTPPTVSGGNIVSYWKFDEGTGSSTSADAVGGRTLDVSNAAWNTGGVFGYTGDNSISLNTSQNITVADAAALNPSNITVYAWIKTTDAQGAPGIVDKIRNLGGYALLLSTGKAAFYTRGSDGSFHTCTGTTDVNDNQWHMIAGTFNATTSESKIYVDGALQTTTSTLMGTNNTDTLIIGGDGASTNFYNGLIDNIVIYNTARADADILSDYVSGIGISAGNKLAFNFNTSTSLAPTDKLASWKSLGAEKSFLNGNGDLYVNSVIDSSNNKELLFNSIPSAVNYLTLTNGATTAGPAISSDGETDVSLYIKSKGTGSVVIPSQSAGQIPLIVSGFDAQTGNLQEWRNNLGVALLSVSNLGYLTLNTVDPEIRLIDSGNTEYARITRSDTSNKLILYNRVSVPGASTGAGYQLNFDNTERYVTYSNSSALRPANVSVEVWANVADASANKRSDIFIQDDTYTYSTGYQLFTYFSLLYWRVGNGSTYSTVSVPINDSTWYHIVGTYDGSNMHLFVNGLEIGSGTALAGPIAYNVTNPLTGRYIGTSAYYLNGSIDELKVYNSALNLTQVQESYNTGSGLYGTAGGSLVAGYHFDEGSGTTAADYSGNALMANYSVNPPIWAAAVKAINPVGPGTVSEIAVLQSEDGVEIGEAGILTVGNAGGITKIIGGNVWLGTDQLLSVSSTGILTSGVITGTAPFVITSTTEVTNLNANLLQGHPASDFALAGGGGGTPDGNSWALVYDNAVMESAVTDVTATGLNGDADQLYKFEFKLVCGAAGSPEIYIQPNADASTSSYRNTYALPGTAASTITTVEGMYTTYCDDITGLAFFEGSLFSKSGTNRGGMGKSYMRADGTTNASNFNDQGYVWLNSENIITNIKFHSSVPLGIGVGSHFMIWKKN